NVQQIYSALYAHPNKDVEIASGGRQMGGHFATPNVDEHGNWLKLSKLKNSSADISPTAGQMPRLLGLALASKVFKENTDLHAFENYSDKGNEVAFGTIGDASTSEGHFWETMNAAAVLQVPMVMSVWDDGYGISVAREHQTTKDSISKALAGFQRDENDPGMEILTVKGWDYPSLVKTYEQATKIAREQHVPVLVHVQEVTQPQGHSTSGSHERYKNEERMQFEKDFDCIAKFKEWIVAFQYQGENIATIEQLDEIHETTKKEVRTAQKDAWKLYQDEVKEENNTLIALIEDLAAGVSRKDDLLAIVKDIKSEMAAMIRHGISGARTALRMTIGEDSPAREALKLELERLQEKNVDRYNDSLYTEDSTSSLNVPQVDPDFTDEMADGRLILRDNFDKLFEENPLILTFGEDTGEIGGVNQSMENMQTKFGKVRVSDTGIREATIIGQGIGMAMRGLRPIAEIQYLDYIYYGLQILSDDLSTLQYRTKGQQKAPLIVRTRGHRLEGIWHSGSPIGTLINALKGMRFCVPRNMTKAAGFYNTLLSSDDPALVIEPLNGYRLKENVPSNYGEFTEALGYPEIVREGTDVTMLSYGSTFNLCEKALALFDEVGISVELIDAQTLLPFDIEGMVAKSLEKTNRLIIVDEDVNGGASSYLLDEVLTKQGGYFHLDSAPEILCAQDHRPAYASDGDYFSKPSIDDIFERTYAIMSEADPSRFPAI
ncbi:MAG: 2-oxoisovalerate dehydrogenase E1 component, partial [Patiriisocius sp.]